MEDPLALPVGGIVRFVMPMPTRLRMAILDMLLAWFVTLRPDLPLDFRSFDLEGMVCSSHGVSVIGKCKEL